MLKEFLKQNIKRLVGDEKDIAIAFSGGTDSLCMLYTAMELGYKPVLYTYYVNGYYSQDRQYSRKIANMYELKLVECPIKSDLGSLKHDVQLMLQMGIKGKVNIQCCHGHLYVAEKVKEKKILNGSGIDGIYGSYKTFVFDGSKENLGLFNFSRRKHLSNPNDDAMLYQNMIYGNKGVKVLYPYRQKNILDYLMTKTWEEINKPKNKYIITKEFEEFNMRGIYRPRGSQQIIAGTRGLHEKLLESDLNHYNRNSVMHLYKDLGIHIRA